MTYYYALLDTKSKCCTNCWCDLESAMQHANGNVRHAEYRDEQGHKWEQQHTISLPPAEVIPQNPVRWVTNNSAIELRDIFQGAWSKKLMPHEDETRRKQGDHVWHYFAKHNAQMAHSPVQLKSKKERSNLARLWNNVVFRSRTKLTRATSWRLEAAKAEGQITTAHACIVTLTHMQEEHQWTDASLLLRTHSSNQVHDHHSVSNRHVLWWISRKEDTKNYQKQRRKRQTEENTCETLCHQSEQQASKMEANDHPTRKISHIRI